MRIIQKLFGPKRPILFKSDIPNKEKVFAFLIWFIENDPNVKEITNKSCNLIFNEGYRPRIINFFSTKTENLDAENIIMWFMLKMYFDLNSLKNCNESEFRSYLKVLDEYWREALVTSGDLAIKYNIEFSNFDYNKELSKIPVGTELRDFKQFLLEENIMGAQIRILLWLFHAYFGVWYKSQL